MKIIYQDTYKDKILLVKDVKKTYKVNLEERLLVFASDVIKFLFLLPNTKELDVFKIQLSKASTSIGANYEESQASTYKEFSHRIRICLRESKEAHYFFKVLQKTELEKTNLIFKNKEKYILELNRLANETDEITRIFGSICSKTKDANKY